MSSTRRASSQIPRRQLPSQTWPPQPTFLVNQLGKYSSQITSLSKPLREFLSTKCIRSWDQTKKIPLPDLRQRWPHPEFWPGTTQWSLPRSPQMPHHMAWGQYCSSRQPRDGIQLPMYPDPWQMPRLDMPKWRKKHWLSLEHVRSSSHTSWAWQSSWRLTTNHLWLYLATPTWTTYHHGHYTSVSDWRNSATPSVTCQWSYFILCWCSASMYHQVTPYSGYNHSAGESGVPHHSRCYVTMQLPASEEHLKVYRSTQMQDPLCSIVIEFKTGWLNKQQVRPELKPFWEAHGLLTGHPEMSSVSLYLSLMARNLQRHGETCATVPTMQQVPSPSWGAPHAYPFTCTLLGEGGSRFVRVQRLHLPGCRWLLGR